MIMAINESGRRMAAIVNNMLSFARKSSAQVSSHSPDELCDNTSEQDLAFLFPISSSLKIMMEK